MNFSPILLPKGVQRVPLISFLDERGSVLKMLSITESYSINIGEVYFSTFNPSFSKGWKLHKLLTMACCCVYGSLNLYIYDNRITSPTRYVASKISLKPDEHSLLIIPPNIWYGIESNSNDVSVLAVVINGPHDPSESLSSNELLSTSPTDLIPI